MNIQLNKKYFFAIFSFVIVATYHDFTHTVYARISVMSETEINERLAACRENPDCKKAYERIKQEQAVKQQQFDETCKHSKKDCQSLIETDVAKLAESMAYCHSNSSNCLDEMNANADEQEKALVESRWCNSRPRICEYLKSLRNRRSNTGKLWCDDNKAVCEKVLNKIHAAQEKRKQRLIDAKTKRQKQQFTALKQKITNEWNKRDTEYTRCSDQESCEKSINLAHQARAVARAKMVCKQDENSDLCKVSSEIGKELNTEGSRWCDQNPNECDQARQRAQNP